MTKTLAPTSCLECGDPIPSKNSTFCSMDCRNEHTMTKLSEPDYERVEAMASAGQYEVSIRRALGIDSSATWAKLKDRDPSLTEALEAGRAQLHDELMTAQKARAVDVEHPQGFLANAMLLNSMFGYREGKSVEVNNNVRIILPEAKTREAYLAALDREPDAIEGEILEEGNEG